MDDNKYVKYVRSIYDVRLKQDEILLNGEAILLGSKPVYLYENGRKVDTVVAQRYHVLNEANDYEHLQIKANGSEPIIKNEDLEKMKQTGTKVKVRFKNLVGKFYRKDTGEWVLSYSADGVEVIK